MKNNLNAVGAIKVALQTEIDSYRMYSKALRFVENSKSLEMIRMLAREELNHKKRLEDLYAKLSGRRVLALNLRFKPVHRHITQKDIAPFRVLEYAIWNEKDSILFYDKASEDCTDLEGKQMFKKLALEEKKHLELFEMEFEVRKKDEEKESYFNTEINQDKHALVE